MISKKLKDLMNRTREKKQLEELQALAFVRSECGPFVWAEPETGDPKQYMLKVSEQTGVPVDVLSDPAHRTWTDPVTGAVWYIGRSATAGLGSTIFGGVSTAKFYDKTGG